MSWLTKKGANSGVEIGFFVKRVYIFVKKTLKKENTYIRIG